MRKGWAGKVILAVPGNSLCITFSQYSVVMVTWLSTSKCCKGARGYFSHGTS